MKINCITPIIEIAYLDPHTPHGCTIRNKKIPASLVLSENEFAEPSLSTNLIRCGTKAAPLLNEEFA